MTAASAAILALVLQLWAAVLVPAAAAQPVLEICTGEGIVHLPPPGSTDVPGSDHPHCDLCVLAAVAAPTPPVPQVVRRQLAPAIATLPRSTPIQSSPRLLRPPTRGPPSV